MQYYTGLLIGWRYKSYNSFSVAHPVVFWMPLFMPLGMYRVYATWLVSSLCHLACIEFIPLGMYRVMLLFCCSQRTCIIVLSLLRGIGVTKELFRMLRLSGVCCSDVVENHGLPTFVVPPFAFDPADCWFIIALLICYILNKSLILSSHSLQYFALFSAFVYKFCHIHVYIYHEKLISI